MKFLYSLLFLVASNHSVVTNATESCPESQFIPPKQQIVLDPRIGLGNLNCTDLGKVSKGCDCVNVQCVLTPVENKYYYQCRWDNIPNFRVQVTVDKPYDTVNVTLTPRVDWTPENVGLTAGLITLLIVAIAYIGIDGLQWAVIGYVLFDSSIPKCTCSGMS